MGYTKLEEVTKRKLRTRDYEKNTLSGAALFFIREHCEGLQFAGDAQKQLGGGV